MGVENGQVVDGFFPPCAVSILRLSKLPSRVENQRNSRTKEPLLRGPKIVAGEKSVDTLSVQSKVHLRRLEMK